MVKRWLVVAALLASASSSAFAQDQDRGCRYDAKLESWIGCGPLVGLTVDGKVVDGFNPTPVSDDNGKTWSLGEYKFGTDAYSVLLSLRSNPDPTLSYALSITNFTATPVSFHFTFTSPYVGGTYSAVNSSFSSTYTGTPASTTIGASGGTHIHRPFVDGDPVEDAFIATSCVVDGSGTCSYPGATGVAYSTAATGVFGVAVGLTLPPGAMDVTGARDTFTYTATGSFDLTDAVSVVPEPATILMLSVGLGVIGAAGARRRRDA